MKHSSCKRNKQLFVWIFKIHCHPSVSAFGSGQMSNLNRGRMGIIISTLLSSLKVSLIITVSLFIILAEDSVWKTFTWLSLLCQLLHYKQRDLCWGFANHQKCPFQTWNWGKGSWEVHEHNWARSPLITWLLYVLLKGNSNMVHEWDKWPRNNSKMEVQ